MNTLKDRAVKAHGSNRALAVFSFNDQRALIGAALHGLEMVDMIKAACARAVASGSALDAATLLAWLESETSDLTGDRQ